MTDRNAFIKSVDIAEKIIENGGEISRAEETVKRINNAFEQDCRVFALPTLIIAQCGDFTQIRRIIPHDADLAELTRLNSLSRSICKSFSKEISESDGNYPDIIEKISVFGATGAFSIFFGGTLLDALFSGIIGLIITYPPYKKMSLPLFSSNLLDSFIAGVLACLPAVFGIDTHRDKIIIGTIMLLVPGLTVVNAIRDMMSSDLFAGLIELVIAIMSALGIALGTAGALMIFKGL